MAEKDPVHTAEESVLNSLSTNMPNEPKIENAQRLTGFGIGALSMLAAQAATHPFLVFRRQCQVNGNAQRYHVTPFSVFQVMIKLERKQGASCLWKGYGSTYIVCAVNFFSEAAISAVTQLPQDKPSSEMSMSEVASHLLLKCLGLIFSMPIAAASLVETVKTERIKDGYGVIDTFKDGLYRLVGWNRSSGRHGRLLPMWTIAAPTILHGMLHYLVESIIQHLVLIKMGHTGLYGDCNEDPPPTSDMTQSYYPELVANFMAFVVPDLILYPFETVLHRLYIQGTRTIIDDLDNAADVIPLSTNYFSMLDCFRTIYQQEGIFGFYRGFGALLIQCVVYFVILKITKVVYVRLSQDFQGKTE
ncbi:predicted protein [Nematostella vectensis]|uniref:Solute carrier family 25 member 46 n=1 Tax=Nematostella vectensis TaxID=45351 RepID=A7SSC5_NEMVE|nr:predicted protein [Nematostella vectensis]|eukprot:XP_001625495.1 predicted protein [Nematostella vectensis]